jgi:RimJ/RimL family protein N-acetyltransferase
MPQCRRLDTAVTSSDFSEFSYRLLNEKNYLPDVLHDLPRMMSEYARVMGSCCQPFALVDGKNKMGGVFFISDIEPGHQATFYAWLWGRVYSATTNRFMMGYIEHYAEEYQLSRVVCRTPDERLGAMLERLGFKLEGRFAKGYRSGGKSMCLYQHRRLFRFGGV